MAGSRLRLEIQLGEEKPAYRCDRELTGCVLLDCNGHNHLPAAKFFVECIGFSETIEQSSSGSQRRHRREHLLLKQNILPGSQVVESRRYDFRFRLPSSLPHSVECDDVGFVRYCCRVVLEDSLTASTHEAVSYFSLIEEVDLNSEPVRAVCRPSDQVSATASNRLNDFNKHGEVKASLVLSKSAYVPGESVQCSISLLGTNSSLSPVEGAIVRLVQTVTALGDNGRVFNGSRGASRRTIIAEDSVQADEQYSEHCWMARCSLHIPGTVASSLLHVHSVQHPLSIIYEVEMHACLGTSAHEIAVSCPVLIGTLPLLENTGGKPLHPAATQPSIVEVCRCAIADGDHLLARDGRHQQAHSTRSSSFIGQLSLSIPGQGTRRKSSARATPPVPYTLYCIYYPMLSLIRQQKTCLKSILKRHSVDNSIEASGYGHSDKDKEQDQELMQTVQLKTSNSWYETPL